MEYNEFIKTIMTLVLVKNDCHYMHLMSKGEDFDKSHHLTQDYFESLGYVIDIISEMALESGNTMYNYSLAGQIIPDYAPENLPAYDYPTLIEHLKTKIAIVVASLQTLRESITDTSIQSKLDDIIRNWESELNYKLNRRSEPSVNMSGFINTGLDAMTVESYNKTHI